MKSLAIFHVTSGEGKALAGIYPSIGLPAFNHHFANIEPDCDAMLFDARIASSDLHAVGARIHSPPRSTVLPPDLFDAHVKSAVWYQPDGLPDGVHMV